jgi:hypothetical protein
MLLSSFFIKIYLTVLVMTMINNSYASDSKSKIPKDVPVVFVIFGDMPDYFLVNVELASRLNPVIIITDKFTSKADSWISDSEYYHDDSNTSRSNKGNDTQKQTSFKTHKQRNKPVTYIGLDSLSINLKSNIFAKSYQHYCSDTSPHRIQHEIQNFQRWYVLYEYMMKYNKTHIFFGDGDTSVYADMTKVWENNRNHCDASIIIPGTARDLNWVGTGCSSLWTLSALESFVEFMTHIYTDISYKRTLQIKAKNAGGCVVDMSILWLWWVQLTKKKSIGEASNNAANNSSNSIWNNGRPYLSINWKISPKKMQLYYDHAYLYASKLHLPIPKGVNKFINNNHDNNKVLHICNGLDVVNRTVFDHMVGWSDASHPSLYYNRRADEENTVDYSARGIMSTTVIDADADAASNVVNDMCPYSCPSAVGISLKSGGIPETMDPNDIIVLSKKRLYFLTFHYQGGAKKYILYDGCRILITTGTKYIIHSKIRKLCYSIFKDMTSEKYHKSNNNVPEITIPTMKVVSDNMLDDIKTDQLPCVYHDLYGHQPVGNKQPKVCF